MIAGTHRAAAISRLFTCIAVAAATLLFAACPDPYSDPPEPDSPLTSATPIPEARYVLAGFGPDLIIGDDSGLLQTVAFLDQDGQPMEASLSIYGYDQVSPEEVLFQGYAGEGTFVLAPRTGTLTRFPSSISGPRTVAIRGNYIYWQEWDHTGSGPTHLVNQSTGESSQITLAGYHMRVTGDGHVQSSNSLYNLDGSPPVDANFAEAGSRAGHTFYGPDLELYVHDDTDPYILKRVELDGDTAITPVLENSGAYPVDGSPVYAYEYSPYSGEVTISGHRGEGSIVHVTFTGNTPNVSYLSVPSGEYHWVSVGYRWRRGGSLPGYSARRVGTSDTWVDVFTSPPGSDGVFLGPYYVCTEYITGTTVGIYYVSIYDTTPRLLGELEGSLDTVPPRTTLLN